MNEATSLIEMQRRAAAYVSTPNDLSFAQKLVDFTLSEMRRPADPQRDLKQAAEVMLGEFEAYCPGVEADQKMLGPQMVRDALAGLTRSGDGA